MSTEEKVMESQEENVAKTPAEKSPDAVASKEDVKKPTRPARPERGDRRERPKKEFEELLLEVRRVTRVNTGGRQLSFRAIILVGNKKGKIGLGISKGADVAIAVRKATHEAYKNIKVVPITESGSVPYSMTHKFKSAIIRIIPAAPGTGLKA